MSSSRFTTGLSEVALGVADVREAARFYTEVVGLVAETISDDFASLAAGRRRQSRRVILLSRTLPPLTDRGGDHLEVSGDDPFANWRPGLLGPNHFALHVPRERLAAALDHVRSQDVAVSGPLYFEWMQAAAYYFFDLDQNLVEFWSPGDPIE